MVTLCVLVAFDDFLVRHLSEVVTVMDAFHVPNGRARWLMYLPKGDYLSRQRELA
jgi:hypothetical protein